MKLDSASGKMTDTVKQSVNAALTQVEKEIKTNWTGAAETCRQCAESGGYSG